jgi:hypothetical protein
MYFNISAGGLAYLLGICKILLVGVRYTQAFMKTAFGVFFIDNIRAFGGFIVSFIYFCANRVLPQGYCIGFMLIAFVGISK